MRKIGALIFCLIFLGLGIYLKFFSTKGYIKTDAVITRIETSYNGDDTDYDVYVKYTVDGKEYEGESGVYVAGYHEGKTVTIYYDPDDPSHIKGEAGFIGYIFMGVGIMSLLVVIFRIIRGR